MNRLAVRALKLFAWASIYGALLWYGVRTFPNPGILDKSIIGLTVFGVTYGISRPLFEALSEIAGGIMVIAEFLNRHLLEPQKQRLLEQGREAGREEGRAQERAEIHARLKKLGLDPSEILEDHDAQNDRKDN